MSVTISIQDNATPAYQRDVTAFAQHKGDLPEAEV